MIIKILGTGCAKCKAMTNVVQAVVIKNNFARGSRSTRALATTRSGSGYPTIIRGMSATRSLSPARALIGARTWRRMLRILVHTTRVARARAIRIFSRSPTLPKSLKMATATTFGTMAES